MNSVNLTAREILYIASLCGADEFWGIPDGFYGMDEAEIASEVNNIKLVLVDKGYANMNFDGDFEIANEVKEIISICFDCDKYISFDRTGLNKNHILRFYMKNNLIFKITETDNTYSICKSFENEVKKTLIEFVKWSEEKQISEESIVLENELLRKVKAMNEFDNPENELKLMGCDNLKAKILYGGLSGVADYYSLTVIDFKAENDEIDNLMFIHSAEGAVELEVLPEEADKVKINPITYEKMLCRMSDILLRILPESEVSFT